MVQSAGHMYFSSVVTVDWALAGYAEATTDHTMPHSHAVELTRLMLILNKYRDSPMEKAHCSNSFSVVDELLVSGQMHETVNPSTPLL